MSQVPEQCPKCGAEYKSSIDGSWRTYACGTELCAATYDAGSKPIESEACLRNQLAATTEERTAVNELIAMLRTWRDERYKLKQMKRGVVLASEMDIAMAEDHVSNIEHKVLLLLEEIPEND